jgi:Polysaccharide biosynthesis/export protein
MLESRTLRVWFVATLLTCAISCGEALRAQEKQHSAPPTTEYRIHPGDVIKIDVWKQPEITRTVWVNRDGKIDLPLVGVVKVCGLSAMDLAALIRNKLESKISNPQVTVTITEISNPSALPPQAVPKAPVHPYQSPSPDLRQTCCVAWAAPLPFVDAPATLPYTISVEMVLKPAESPQSHS